MGGPSLPHRARILVWLLLLSGAGATPGLQAPARAQEAMVQWRQQIQNSFGSGSIPSPASYGTLAPATAPAPAATPAATPATQAPVTSPPTPSASRAGAAAGAASNPAPATAATTCPPLRVSEMARIRAGRPVRVRGGNCLMEFN